MTSPDGETIRGGHYLREDNNQGNTVFENLKGNHYPSQHYRLTGKSLSEALIFASTNPQYDNGLFIELRAQQMKIASLEHVYRNYCLFL